MAQQTTKTVKKVLQNALLPGDKFWEPNIMARAQWNVSSPYSEQIIMQLLYEFQQTGELKEKEFSLVEILGSYATGPEYEQAKTLSQKIRSDFVHIPFSEAGFADYNLFRGRLYYSAKKKTITIGLNPDLKKFYENIKDNFSVIGITEFKSLKLGKAWHYTQRLYHNLKSWEPHKLTDRGQWIVSVEDLKYRLGADKIASYKKFSEFRKIVDRALQNINSSTTLEVDYTLRKIGKSYTHFIFQHHTYSVVHYKHR